MRLAAAALLLPGLAALATGRTPADTAGEPRSLAVYPEQQIALRVNHAAHLRRQIRCHACHDRIAASESASDRNIPAEERCAACHAIEEARAGKPVSPPSACQDCHAGFDWTVQRAPRASRFPPANLHFSHARHLGRGAQCRDCHGDLSRVDLATRADLPRMATCLGCHDGARAPSTCATCHPTSQRARGARLETEYPSGKLVPGPGDPFGLDHGPRWERSHALAAAGQRARCLACHAEPSCNRCHDALVRPQAVHPGDFLSTHMVPARQQAERCDACHRRQSFCVACHERTGVGRNADPAFQDPSARVHPPGWLTPGTGHHAVQAARNMGSCVSCHREEQCLGCHAATSGGVRPHPPGFASGCRSLLRRNERACARCHALGDPADAAARCR